MSSRKTFWVIAVIVALAGIAAAVAFFVTKYMRSRQQVDDLGDYCDELESIYTDDYDALDEEEYAE
ncbi:MAG: hypothetical protein IJ462_02025 [Clostridia bacterium]|nr:hypothetical protein [Clostridia bacterium]